MAVIVAASIAAASVGVRGVVRTREAAEAARATQRLERRLATCVVGETPLGGPDVEDRARMFVRASQLTSMGIPPVRRLARPELRWPAGCAVLARAAADDDRRHGDAPGADLADRLAAAFEGDDGASADWTPVFLSWLAHVRARGTAGGALALGTGELHVQGESDVPSPSSSPRADSVGSLDANARILPAGAALDRVHFAPFFDDTVAFVVDAVSANAGAEESRPAMYCSYDGERLRCTEMHGAAAVAAEAGSLRPWGTRDAGGAALVFAGDRGTAGIYEVDSGERLAIDLAHPVYGASTSPAGVDLVGWSFLVPEIRLFHLDPTHKMTETPLLTRAAAGDPDYNVGLFWGVFVSKRFTNEAPGLRLRVRDISGGVPGMEVDLGQIGEVPRFEAAGEQAEHAHVSACRTKGAMALRIRGWDADYFSFRQPPASAKADPAASREWSRPVELFGSGGTMSCRPGEVTLVDARGHVEGRRYEPVVTESRCTPDLCRTETLQTREVFADNLDVTPRGARGLNELEVAAIDGKVLLVWRAGDIGGLRMRFGKLAQLSRREDVVLFDDHVEHDTLRRESTLKDFHVRAVAGGALVLLETIAGTFVYRIDARGAFSSLPVE